MDSVCVTGIGAWRGLITNCDVLRRFWRASSVEYLGKDQVNAGWHTCGLVHDVQEPPGIPDDTNS